ncbi:hypothetical protein PVAND_000119 [Polypedilum vanderplanki]|uniref:NACHT domain-containing protein n=1 Tax=Polypedilum vanderplanki TaxID=319348 RepID=A0A9J6BJC8_POLVA|nr:hypothetical protein PVAND_000119 [Polypedilum vanderplanki]
MSENLSSPASLFVRYNAEVNSILESIKIMKKNLKDSKNENNNYELTVTKCPSVNKASELINNQKFLFKIFDNLKSVVVIRIIIKESLKDANVNKPKIEKFKDKESFVIIFESNKSEQFILHWKNKNAENFLSLNLNNNEQSIKVTTFAVEFIKNSITMQRNVTYSCNQYQLTNLIDSRNFNLIMAAIENNQFQIFRALLSLPFDINHKTLSDETAADIAWEKNYQNFLLELLKANSTYPKNFKAAQCNQAVVEIYIKSLRMHAAIRAGNHKSIKKILKRNKNLRYYYDEDNVSASTVAIENSKISNYEQLIEENCSFGPLENFNEILERLKATLDEEKFDNVKYTINNIHSRNILQLPQKHLLVHESNSYLGHDDQHPGQRLKLIRNAFKRIDQIPQIRLILQVNAILRNSKNHFDFNRSSLQHMLPSLCDNLTSGLFSSTGAVYFAAQKLTQKNQENEVDGIMSHEHCHCCCNNIFKNFAKPYAINDTENESRFQKIIYECLEILFEMKEKNEELEPIIVYVFNSYNEEYWPAELIVRVPHILAHYQNDEIKLAQLKTTFKNLFKYFDEVVTSAMTDALPVLERLSNKSVDIKFSELTPPLKAFIFESSVKFQEQKIKLKEIADEEILKNLTSEQIRNILEDEYLSLGKWTTTEEICYIERLFIDSDFKGEIYKIDNETNEMKFTVNVVTKAKDVEIIAEEVKNSKLFLLSDHAGAGKSTAINHLAVKLKEKWPNNWILYIDLKRHLNTYKKFSFKTKEKISKDLQLKEHKKIILDILIAILSPIEKLELKIFSKLFNDGKVILLYDALDEIAPIYKDFFLNMIKNIKYFTNNQQLIATRPQYTEELKIIFDHKTYKLLPLDQVEIEKFITIILHSNHVLTEDTNIQIAKIKQLSLSLKIFDNPLMLKMIMELEIAGKLSRENVNSFDLYQTLIELKKDILMDKGNIVNRENNNDSKVSLWEVHQIYALQLIFQQNKFKNFLKTIEEEFVNFDNFELFKKWQKEKSKWTPEAISRCGFLTISSWNTVNEYPEFVHRTFAEFFTAKFIIEVVEEAVSANTNELNIIEFNIRMNLLAFIVINYCINLSNTENILNFIIDYLSTKNFKNVHFGEHFLNFLLKKRFKRFILKILQIQNVNSRKKIVKIVLKLLPLLKNQNENILKSLIVSNENESKIFKIIFGTEGFESECLMLFGFLKSKKLLKLTGFGKNFNENHLQSKIDEKLSIFEKFYTLHAFLYFLENVNDVPLIECKTFLCNILKKYPTFVLESQFRIETIFNINRKYFENTEIFLSIFTEILKSLYHSISTMNKNPNVNINSIENINSLIKSFEINLNFDINLINQILNNYELKNILGFASMHDIHAIKNLYIQNLSQIELNKIFLCDLTFIIRNDLFCKNIGNLNEACLKMTEYSNCFQFLLHHSNDYELVSKVLIDLKNDYKSDWFTYIGYKSKNMINQEKNESLCILNILQEIEIPLFDLQIFLQKYLGEMIKLILYEDKNATKIFFKTLKSLFEDSKTILGEIITDIKFSNNQIKKINDDSFNFFCCKLLENSLESNNLLKKFLIIKYDVNEIHPLIYGINFNKRNFIKYFELIEKKEITFIFFQQLEMINLLSEVNCKNFEFFFKKLSNYFGNLEKIEDIVRISDDEDKEEFERQSKSSKIVYHFLTFISKIEDSRQEIFGMFLKKLPEILVFSFRSCSLINKVFEIFEKNYCENKTVIIDYIRKGLDETNFFNPLLLNNVLITFECRSTIVHFYEKMEIFLKNDVELISKLFLSNYCYNHPLILSIYYKIENLKLFYFKHFDLKVICNILKTELSSISRYFVYDSFKMFIQNTDINDVILMNEGTSNHILNLIENYLKTITDDIYVNTEIKLANLHKYQELFCELSIKSSAINNLIKMQTLLISNNLIVLSQAFNVIFLEDLNSPATSTKKIVFDYFYRQLNVYTNFGNISNIKELLLQKYEFRQFHPLIVAFCFNVRSAIEFYLKCLNPHDITVILIENILQISAFSKFKWTSNIFIEFFASIYPEFSVTSKFDFMLKTTLETENQFEKDKNNSEILFNFLGLITSVTNPSFFIELFLDKNIVKLLPYVLRSRAMVDKIFEIFKIYFNQDKIKVALLIKEGIDKTIFFNPIECMNQSITVDCLSIVEYFWSKVFNFFDLKQKEIQGILSSQYKYNNPFVLSICYEIDNLKKFYFKHFKHQEIISLLLNSNYESTTRYFSYNQFENPFFQIFLNDLTHTEVKTFIEKTSNDGDNLILKAIENELKKNAENDYNCSAEITINLIHFIDFMIKISENVNFNFFKEFCFIFHSSKTILSQTLLDLGVNLEFFFDFASRHDCELLDQISIKFYNFEHFESVCMKVLAFDYFYRLLDKYLYKSNLDWFRIFLKLTPNTNQIHPLIIAIKLNIETVILLYKKCFDHNDILKIIFENIFHINYIEDFNVTNFEKFFSSIYPDFIYISLKTDIVQCNTYQNHEDYIYWSKRLQILYKLLNYLASSSLLQQQLEFFLKNHFGNILWYAFRSFTITEKLFEILKEKLKDKTFLFMEITQMIQKGFDNIEFLSINAANGKTITDEFIKLIEFFWIKTENLFCEDPPYIREIILGKYKFIHPLVLGIYYNMLPNFMLNILMNTSLKDFFK